METMVVAPLLCVNNAPKKSEKSQQEFKTLNPTHVPSELKTDNRKDEAWEGHT